jgi:cytochrome c biogenesis protein CcdA
VLRLAIVGLTVGLADSLNPSTVGPAVYLATVANGARRVMQFTLGVFGVNLVLGLLLVLGPGSVLIGLIPHPQATGRHVVELVAGIVLLFAAAALWLGRRKLARHELPTGGRAGGSALAAGASIAVVELPTAVPYFAFAVAVVGSSATTPGKIALVGIYNVAFVAPLLAIAFALVIIGEAADPWLQRAGDWLQRRWPIVLATLLLLVGSVLTLVGGTGLVRV